MSTPPITRETAEEAVQAMIRHNGNRSAAAREMGIATSTLENRIKRAEQLYGIIAPVAVKNVGSAESGIDIDRKGMRGTLHLNGRVTTEADAIEKSQIDLDEWEIESMRFSFYETTVKHENGTPETVPMTAVKFRAKRRSPLSVERMHKQYIEAMKRAAPRYPKIKRPKKRSGVMLEVSIPDLHIGKYAWEDETGEAYNIKIAERVFKQAVESLVSRAAAMGPIDLVLFPVGNDLLHVDNDKQTTTRGTLQDTDGQWQRMYIRARKLMVWAIERLRAVAPVHVIGVYGNHARTKEFCLVDALECWFHQCDDVTIDNTPKKQKYFEWGTVLLGFSHGDEIRHDELPKVMARDCKDAYSKATYMEWHLGHFHVKRKKPGAIEDTHGDVHVRIIKSLSGTDAWHHSKGYGSPKGAEAFLFTRTGLDAVLNFTPDQSEYKEVA